MATLEESVVRAMDGSSAELFPFIPYILQDIWELGASPDIVISLVKKHSKSNNYRSLRVLDLGCGKGAVPIRISESLDCFCLGIDALGEFIQEAEKKAQEYNVNALCRFITGDIRREVPYLRGFDIIILGSIGPVLGDCYETLTTLDHCLGDEGIIIIDDGYIDDNSSYTHSGVLTRSEITAQISRADMILIDEIISERDRIRESDEYIFKRLKKRCEELIMSWPEKRALFEGYIKDQEREGEALANEIICSTMVIKRKI